MRILLHKISDDRHTLEIVRADGRRERVDCETRSYLQHDLLHYAVETEASLAAGFWGSLIVSAIGAILFLALLGLFRRRPMS